LAKQIRYTIEVEFNGNKLYYQNDVSRVNYVALEEASSTTDFYELATWNYYVKQDFDAGSVTAYDVVELELKVKSANVKKEMNAAAIGKAQGKLTKIERDALGI
jgi:hypothetical protein